jgi:DNA modification methylase
MEVLPTLAAESVDCCVTSPPYYGLRDYGTGAWEGGDPECDHLRHAGNANKGNLAVTPMGDVCARCGAVRVDQQIGLEQTLDEYVQKLVAVFREVRRVLKPTGTLWLNPGDSYASQGGDHSGRGDNQVGVGAGVVRGAGNGDAGNRKPPAGLRPGDLMGVPWRVAFALQADHEQHTITAPTDRAWMAGLVDGEGCITCSAIPSKCNGNASHSVRLQVRMADVEAVERVVVITGANSVTYDQWPPSYQAARQRPAQQWKVSGDVAASIIADIYPFLTVKRRQAIVAWNLQRLKDGVVTRRGQRIPEENMEKRRVLHDVLHRLNQREAADIPGWCVEPSFEVTPGWILRSDLIWHKPNPMPESVENRCTKAHEYIFMLAKAPGYYFDAAAIAEKGVCPAGTRGGKASAERSNESRVNSRPPEAKVYDGTRNKRDVWTVATRGYSEAHFATFPPALIEPCILAGCPQEVCGACGQWAPEFGSALDRLPCPECGADMCEVGRRPGVVLDPFAGSGTTADVAATHGRDAVLIELSETYCGLIRNRLGKNLFAEVS